MMTEKEAAAFLEEAGKRGSVYGLETMRELLKRLKEPQEELRFVHIAGTNGKGSTAAFLDAALRCAGYRTGSYTSPAVFSDRERIRVNGRPIGPRALCRHLDGVRAAAESMEADGLSLPTAFEMETAVAFLYFREKKCGIVVLETGLGGSEDATNVVENTIAAVITSVSMDHMALLGGSLEEIASHKAGIIKKGCAAVMLRQDQRVEQVIKARCGGLGCPLTTAEPARGVKYGLKKQKFSYKSYKNLEISMAGKFQIANAAVAVETLEVLAERGYPVPEKALREGLSRAVWPGRFFTASEKPLFVLDGAHNEDAARKLADSVGFYFTNRKIVYIMGVLRDKEYDKIIQNTCALAEQIITVTPPHNPRALTAYELAVAVKEQFPNVTAADSLTEAAEMARLLAGKDGVVVAFGSLSYLGELLHVLRRQEEKEKGARRKAFI